MAASSPDHSPLPLHHLGALSSTIGAGELDADLSELIASINARTTAIATARTADACRVFTLVGASASVNASNRTTYAASSGPSTSTTAMPWWCCWIVSSGASAHATFAAPPRC